MEQRRVGIVILGAGGYMGEIGIRALGFLNEKLAQENTELKSLFFAEPKWSKWVNIANLCNEHTNQIPILTNRLSEILSLLDARVENEKYPIIIYDATPTSIHYGQLIDVHQRNDTSLIYLCEKPIFTDERERLYIEKNAEEDFNFFCDFIETENPVLHSVQNYLQSSPNLIIDEIWLWRASGSGIAKAISKGRDGAEGGGLEDKSLHDLSISTALLGPENIIEGIVRDAQIHNLIFHSNFYTKKEKSFLTAVNKPTLQINNKIKEKNLLPADGLLSMEVDWISQNRTVPAKYLFSWLGYNGDEKELEFVNKLKQLGFDIETNDADKKWLDVSSILHSEDKRLSTQLKEVRVGIIECSSSEGKIFIVCNFLAKYNINRFAYAIKLSPNNHPQISKVLYKENNLMGDYDQKKGEDLAKVFHRVIKDALGDEKAHFINKKAILLIHKIFIEAREMAMKNINMDANYWFEKMKPLFEKIITVASE